MNRFHAKMYESCLGAERNIGKHGKKMTPAVLVSDIWRDEVPKIWVHFQRCFFMVYIFRNVGKVNRILTKYLLRWVEPTTNNDPPLFMRGLQFASLSRSAAVALIADVDLTLGGGAALGMILARK